MVKDGRLVPTRVGGATRMGLLTSEPSLEPEPRVKSPDTGTVTFISVRGVGGRRGEESEMSQVGVRVHVFSTLSTKPLAYPYSAFDLVSKCPVRSRKENRSEELADRII